MSPVTIGTRGKGMFGEVEDRGDYTGRVPQGTEQGVQVLVLAKSQKLGHCQKELSEHHHHHHAHSQH